MSDFGLKCWRCLCRRRLPALLSLAFATANVASLFAAETHSYKIHIDQLDIRVAKLESFFRMHACPAPYHIADYLRAADLNGIDYRLLPAVSVRESTCGRYARMNNRWGWDSARTGFESVARGIHFIAHELAFGRAYRGKTLDQKLYAYNPKANYVHEIKRLMNEIDGD